MSVNVEEIMSGIRAEIQEKGYSSDMLSFADVPADADAGIYVERFDADMLRGNVQYISEHHRVDPIVRFPEIPSPSFSRRCCGSS